MLKLSLLTRRKSIAIPRENIFLKPILLLIWKSVTYLGNGNLTELIWI